MGRTLGVTGFVAIATSKREIPLNSALALYAISLDWHNSMSAHSTPYVHTIPLRYSHFLKDSGAPGPQRIVMSSTVAAVVAIPLPPMTQTIPFRELARKFSF